jgi:cyclopropane-fatty-acyl-phospholipid synthase
VQDYRDVVDGPYDAISSIGMAEHVGRSQLPVYAARLHALLRPGGRLLNRRSPEDLRPVPTAPIRGRSSRATTSRTASCSLWRPTSRSSRRPAWRSVTSRGCGPTTRSPAAPGSATSSADGTRRWPCPLPAGHGCGGSTWPVRPSPSRAIGRASTRCSPSGRHLRAGHVRRVGRARAGGRDPA